MSKAAAPFGQSSPFSLTGPATPVDFPLSGAYVMVQPTPQNGQTFWRASKSLFRVTHIRAIGCQG